MAIYENRVRADFNLFSDYLDNVILNGSISATYENGGTYKFGDRWISMRVYERYSYAGGNRVSLSIMLAEEENGYIRICAVTSGGSQALFFKINTWGEEAFLDKLKAAVEAYEQ